MSDTVDLGEGVSSGLFANTHWSVVLRAQGKSEVALETLCQCYREPLLAWLRGRCKSPHDAEDRIQAFFANLLKRDFLKNVSEKKGRFRTFMLTSLKNYLRDEYDKTIRIKRGGGRPVESLQETDRDGLLVHDPAGTENAPDRDYDRAWARTILANALARLEEEGAASGHQALCAALQPVMFADATASSYRELGEELGMSEGAVKTAAHRIRARLKHLVREEVLQTVVDEVELEQEISYLISLF